jgi:3-oxoadipate enol-lactonase
MTTVELHNTIEGPDDGPVLLLGNSLGSTTAMWDPQIADLTRTWRVVRFDHRGHGQSPVPDGPYTLDELGTDVVALMARLGSPGLRTVACRSGDGRYVARRPRAGRIDRLVLCCTSAYMPPREDWSERIGLVLGAGSTEPIADVVGRWLTAGFTAAHPDESHSFGRCSSRRRRSATPAAAPRSATWTCAATCPRSPRRRSSSRRR